MTDPIYKRLIDRQNYLIRLSQACDLLIHSQDPSLEASTVSNLVASKAVIMPEIVKLRDQMTEFKANHRHGWRAVYREDGETHGVCEGCDSHEFVPSRTCGY